MSQAYYSGQYVMSNVSFMGYIQDGQIIRNDAMGASPIGVTTKVYEDLKADYESVRNKCQQYYDKLVELGVIKAELTGEALIKAQAEQLEKMANVLDTVMKRLKQYESVTNNNETASRNLPAVEESNNGSE